MVESTGISAMTSRTLNEMLDNMTNNPIRARRPVAGTTPPWVEGDKAAPSVSLIANSRFPVLLRRRAVRAYLSLQCRDYPYKKAAKWRRSRAPAAKARDNRMSDDADPRAAKILELEKRRRAALIAGRGVPAL